MRALLSRRSLRQLLPVLFFLLAAITPVASLTAQGYASGFETLTASAAGTPASGQDGFYIPAVAGSIDGNFHTYAGNTLGLEAGVRGEQTLNTPRIVHNTDMLEMQVLEQGSQLLHGPIGGHVRSRKSEYVFHVFGIAR